MLPGIAAERINVDVLGGTTLQAVMTIHSASPLSSTQPNPIRGAVAGTSKAFRIHEGRQQDRAITVELFPVARKLTRAERKNRARQAPDANPGKNQKAGIIDNELEVAAALLVVPSNPSV